MKREVESPEERELELRFLRFQHNPNFGWGNVALALLILAITSGWFFMVLASF